MASNFNWNIFFMQMKKSQSSKTLGNAFKAQNYFHVCNKVKKKQKIGYKLLQNS